MQKMVFHIERLLWLHDCVIVPGFGGFVLQTIHANISDKDTTFHPVQREIVFNPSLTHNDGLLTESYMQTEQLEYEEAAERLQEDIHLFKQELSRNNKIDLGKIGQLTHSESGTLLFAPNQEFGLFAPESYGLTIFNFPTIRSVVAETQTIVPTVDSARSNSKSLYLPINRTLIKTAGIAAAAVALFLLLSPPVKESNTASYQASIIPRSAVHKIQETASTLSESIPYFSENHRDNSSSASTDATPMNDGPLTSIPVTQERQYFIIIGSFYSEEQANLHIDNLGLKEKFAHLGIVTRNEKVRVFAQAFKEKDEAESYLLTLRNQSEFESAWLFGSR